MILSTTTSKLLCSVADSGDDPAGVQVAWRDHGKAGEPILLGSKITDLSNDQTDTEIVPPPPSDVSRFIQSIVAHNTGADTINLTFTLTDGVTDIVIFTCPLAVGESAHYSDESGWTMYDANGRATSTPSTSSGSLLRAPQVLTSGTSYTTPAGCTKIRVRAVGGGGGGGGATFVGADMAFGAGGAAGGYLEKFYAVTPLTAYTYAIGAAGAAGADTGANGGTGGDTTFTDGVTLVTAKGGLGGVGQTGAADLAVVLGGAGVISTNGDVNAPGAPGHSAVRLSGLLGGSGAGGSGVFGAGGAGRITNGAGIAGAGRGAGGGGAAAVSANVAGGAGTAGCIVIEEFA